MNIFIRRIGRVSLVMLSFALLAPAVAQTAQAQQQAMQKVVERARSLSQDQILEATDARSLLKLRQVYAQIGDKDRYRWSLQRLIKLRPASLPLRMELAMSYASDDMKTEAYDLLLKMKGQGFGVDLSDMPQFKKIHGTEAWDYIVKSLQANLKPFGEGKKAFELPARDLLYNALAWDPVHKKFLVGSARDGGIYHADNKGKLTPFIRADGHNKLWSIMDMAVDAKRKRLWVATTSVVYFEGYNPDNAGRAALLAFDLDSGKMLERHVLEGRNVFLSDLALAPDGQVFVADGFSRVLYALKDDKLQVLASNKRLNDIRALAVSGDGKILYMADSQIGIIGFDLSDGEAFGLRYNPEGLVLPGIVDMHTYRNTLVLVEPGMQPQRVMRLKLSEDGRSVTNAMPLDVAKPSFKSLGNGTMVGSKLYYMTDNQREQYDSHGLRIEGSKLEPVEVFVSDMDFAWDQSGVNLGVSEIPKASPAQSRKLMKDTATGKDKQQAED